MKRSDVITILSEVTRGKSIDHMSISELREALISFTGLIVGMLLISNKSVEEIKEIIK